MRVHQVYFLVSLWLNTSDEDSWLWPASHSPRKHEGLGLVGTVSLGFVLMWLLALLVSWPITSYGFLGVVLVDD